MSCNEDKYKDTREKSSAGMIILSTLNDNSVITDNNLVKLTPGVVKIQSHSSCKEADMEYKTAAVIDLDNPKIKYADGSVKYRQIVTTKTVNKIKKRLDELGINYILAPSYSDKPQEDIRNIHIIILYASGVHKDKHQQAMQTIYKIIFLSDDKDILAKEYGVDTALNRISQGVYLPVVKKVNFAAYNETLAIVMNRKSLDINAIIDGRMISTKLENNSIKNTKNTDNKCGHIADDNRRKDNDGIKKDNDGVKNTDKDNKKAYYSPATLKKYVNAINTMPEKNVILFITNVIKDYSYVRDEGEGKMRFKYNPSQSEAGVIVFSKPDNKQKDNVLIRYIKSFHSSDAQSSEKACTIMDFWCKKAFADEAWKKAFQAEKTYKNKASMMAYLYSQAVDYLIANSLMELLGQSDWEYNDKPLVDADDVLWSNEEITEYIHSKENSPKRMIRENLNIIFNYSVLYKNRYAFNILTGEPEKYMYNGFTKKINDLENIFSSIALQNEQIFRLSDPSASNSYTKKTFCNYVFNHCKHVNPLGDYFLSLKYEPNGDSLLERFLPDYMGTPNDKYHQNILKYQMMACVKKVIYIDKDFDHKYILCLFSDQNKGKTSFVKELCSVSEQLRETFLPDAGLDGTETEIKSRLRGMTNIFLDEAQKPNRRTLRILKMLVSENELMDKRLYQDEKKVKFRGTFWAGSNSGDFIADNENKRLIPFVPFPGVEGTPTTGIFDKKWHNPLRRKHLYKQLWAEAVYRVVTLKEPLFSELPVKERRYIEQYAEDMCEKLRDLDYIDNMMFPKPGEEQKPSFEDGAIGNIIKKLCQNKTIGDFITLNDILIELNHNNLAYINIHQIGNTISNLGWFTDIDGLVDKRRCRLVGNTRTTKYTIHKQIF